MKRPVLGIGGFGRRAKEFSVVRARNAVPDEQQQLLNQAVVLRGAQQRKVAKQEQRFEPLRGERRGALEALLQPCVRRVPHQFENRLSANR